MSMPVAAPPSSILPAHPMTVLRGMLRPVRSALCLLLLATANSIVAHSVWIEPVGDSLAIRFAEPDGTYEKSPGHLDHLTPPIAFTVVTNSPAPLDAPKKADHFRLVASRPADTACAETSFTVRDGRKPCFYARWEPSLAIASTPRLTLDLVPTGKPGEVRAWFRGRPLAGITATLRRPDGAEIELTADTGGFLQLDTDRPGQYLLTIAHHREPLAGFHGGVAYQQTSHNASLTWRRARP